MCFFSLFYAQDNDSPWDDDVSDDEQQNINSVKIDVVPAENNKNSVLESRKENLPTVDLLFKKNEPTNSIVYSESHDNWDSDDDNNKEEILGAIYPKETVEVVRELCDISNCKSFFIFIQFYIKYVYDFELLAAVLLLNYYNVLVGY